ncbi:gfo/Idh/MocA family oxidoreductase [Sporosarcina sp. ANT_H38]|uniref:Gfo/Idh/MocA family protein n=1 Tax=Sporosarcina sp. ANT_H38 TaxID=2597358 RepID=UPI0011F2E564|nr:Gfo/Idh/MocA family oxidoreductase [Sporosarcina sp. ANT_H38]KAA0965483.1 gfo/Idh/MocA family oxidoreductase [Sporosarcina sp. ANT_H38]
MEGTVCTLKIGIIGLDTTHVVAFTKLLNDPSERYHVQGGKIVVAFSGGSPDFELSMSRVEGFTRELRDNFEVKIVNSIEEVANESDAILVESVDGAVHHEQLRKLVAFKKPIFIDKPFSLSSKVAVEMIRLAADNQTPIMSTSALRYAESLTNVLKISDRGRVIGADCFGPMELQDKQQGFFWYGIHMIEMLFTILGEGSKSVTAITNNEHDVITGVWEDGRIGTVRGNRKGNSQFGAMIHFEQGSEYVDINLNQRPYYASLLEQIMDFFRDGISRVPLSETKEVIRFVEASNESSHYGKTIIM